MRTLRLTIQYDGTDYVGWQRQPNGVSIQELVERAIEPIEGRPVTIVGAGRTDAGVHALGQVASVQLQSAIDAATLMRALNATLPEDVRVASAEEAAPDFNARFSAIGKVYAYRIWRGAFLPPFERRYVWHVPPPLDVERMREAARPLTGRHDFSAFRAAGSDAATSERTIRDLRLDGRGRAHDAHDRRRRIPALHGARDYGNARGCRTGTPFGGKRGGGARLARSRPGRTDRAGEGTGALEGGVLGPPEGGHYDEAETRSA